MSKPKTPKRKAGGGSGRPAPGRVLVPPLPSDAPSAAAPVGAARPARRPAPPPLPSFDRLTLRHDLTPPRDQHAALVPVAKIGKAWGVHGDLIVRLYNADSELAWAADVLLLRGDGFPLVAVEIERWQTKGANVLLRPVGIDSPQVARSLTGLEILVPPEDLPPPEDDDEFYVRELVGMRVEDSEKGPIGTLVEVFPTGANDVWVVKGEGEELLIPALREYVLEVNREERLITVRYDEP